jgi:hypothetical protein
LVLLTSVGAVSDAVFSHYIVFPYMMAFVGTFVNELDDAAPDVTPRHRPGPPARCDIR